MLSAELPPGWYIEDAPDGSAVYVNPSKGLTQKEFPRA
jgi:hypothetical protein